MQSQSLKILCFFLFFFNQNLYSTERLPPLLKGLPLILVLSALSFYEKQIPETELPSFPNPAWLQILAKLKSGSIQYIDARYSNDESVLILHYYKDGRRYVARVPLDGKVQDGKVQDGKVQDGRVLIVEFN